jgi:hypothetical protein
MRRLSFRLATLALVLAACAAPPAEPTPLPPFLDEAAFPSAVSPSAPFTVWQSLATFTKNGVRVELALEHDGAGQVLLAATFTPTRERFHLYSHELPRNGIDGAGRPARVDMPADVTLTPLGAWSADAPTLEDTVEGYRRPFLIYSAGPVTLRLPVRLTVVKATRATLFVTYMACSSDQQCLPPVMDEPVSIELPARSP